jgi:uncharacterized protein YaaW (UPF0174 family)
VSEFHVSNDLLMERLSVCSKADLLELLKDLKVDPNNKAPLSEGQLRLLVSKELRSVAGHSAANVFRAPHAMPYREILVQVADKLTPGLFQRSPYRADRKGDPDDLIENYIFARVQALVEEQVRKLNPEQRSELEAKLVEQLRDQGFSTHMLSGVGAALTSGSFTGVLAAPLMAKLLFGGFWTFLLGMGARQILIGGLAVGAPLGLLIAGLAVAGSPSYRKLIPAVVRLITIRRSHVAMNDW